MHKTPTEKEGSKQSADDPGGGVVLNDGVDGETTDFID